jgi:hypothetical protein
MGSKRASLLSPHQLSTVACAVGKTPEFRSDVHSQVELQPDINPDSTFHMQCAGLGGPQTKALTRSVLNYGNFCPLQEVILTPSTKHFLHDASNICRVA